MHKYKIFLADREQNNLNSYKAYFRRHLDFEIAFFSSSDSLLKELKNSHSDLFVIDHDIISEVGIDFFIKLKVNLIVLTSSRDLQELETLVKHKQIEKYICKPFEMDSLNNIIKSSLVKHS